MSAKPSKISGLPVTVILYTHSNSKLQSIYSVSHTNWKIISSLYKDKNIFFYFM